MTRRVTIEVIWPLRNGSWPPYVTVKARAIRGRKNEYRCEPPKSAAAGPLRLFVNRRP